MYTRGFRHVRVGIDEMHCLSVDAGIEWTNIVLIPVHVQLRLCTVCAGILTAKDLELLRRHRGVEVLDGIANAKFLRGVAVGTGTVLGIEVVEIVRIADFGVVDVKTPDLVHDASVTPVVHPTVFITFCWVLILEDLI